MESTLVKCYSAQQCTKYPCIRQIYKIQHSETSHSLFRCLVFKKKKKNQSIIKFKFDIKLIVGKM